MTPITDTPISVSSQPALIAHLGSLADRMVYRLPGCAELMIRKELQNTAGDFCRRTGIFLVTIEATFDDDDVAPLNVPYSASIKNVLSVTLGDVLLSNTAYRVANGDPPTLTLLENLVLPSDEVQTAVVEAVLVPVAGCEDYPEWMLRDYGDGIVSGALARLFAMSGRPWSDPAQSNMEAVVYQNALTQACLAVRRRGLGSGDLHCRSSRPWINY